ncbi:MAG: hypothetical protein KME64_40215 [Scytonematopsis contorta HA4267-MV1]|jgi:hypothetical protein|nr:hypothetical protein [Scytonematopsis contorta HA4267-MV1]
MNVYYPNSSNISEWTEWHLTPKGWEKGTQKRELEAQLIEVETPVDRVLTFRYHENVSINSVWLEKHITEVWKDLDSKIVDELLEKFGNCPETL